MERSLRTHNADGEAALASIVAVQKMINIPTLKLEIAETWFIAQPGRALDYV